MKNTINYKTLPVITERSNVINLQKAIFNRDKKRQLRPTIKLHNQLSNAIVEDVKNHLAADAFREIIRDSFGNPTKKDELKSIIHNYVSNKEFLQRFSNQITDFGFDELSEMLVEKIAGLDVLQPLAEIETITDIKCIAYDNIWVDDIYKGKYKTAVQFESHSDYNELCQRFAFASNKNYSVAKPSIDAVFPYMRVNIVGQDLSPKISLQLRKISKKLRYDEAYMLNSGFASKEVIELLKKTYGSLSHLILGSTGAGKTEILRYYTRYTKDNGEIIMIEDTPETYLDELYPEKPIQMWRNRESDEGENKTFGYRYHIRNAMRQNPDYIFIQESRGEEFYDILDAALTDHIVNTTLHSFSVQDGAQRGISLCQRHQNHSDEYYGKLITRAFKIGIHTERIGKTRVIKEIGEYIGFENGEIVVNPLIKFNSLTGKHEQVGFLTVETWNRMLEAQKYEFNSDLSTIEQFSPYNQKLK